MSPDSFANQLNRAGITQSTVFGLCFSFNGGIITLGGVDPAVHRDHSATVQYAKLYPRNSWYGVKVLDMRLLRRDGTEQTFSKKNTVATAFTGSSMGTIVDSGTTDTYLPSALLGEFSAAFKAITGIAFRANTQISLTTEQMNIFPDILLELEGASGSPVVVRMPWQNYVEKDAGSNKYEFILFFEESHGAILGANFMDGSEF